MYVAQLERYRKHEGSPIVEMLFKREKVFATEAEALEAISGFGYKQFQNQWDVKGFIRYLSDNVVESVYILDPSALPTPEEIDQDILANAY